MPLSSEDRRLRRKRYREHRTYFVEQFDRMREDVLNALELGILPDSAEDLLPALRWDPRLTEAVFLAQFGTATLFGARAAADLGSTFDVTAMRSGMVITATRAAVNINRRLRERVDRALAGEWKEDLDAADGARAVFAEQTGPRTDYYAQSTMTTAAGMATLVAARQAERGWKVWETNSANPRPGHDIGGERVELGGVFSNGLAYPGDASGGAEMAANCQCTMSFE